MLMQSFLSHSINRKTHFSLKAFVDTFRWLLLVPPLAVLRLDTALCLVLRFCQTKLDKVK